MRQPGLSLRVKLIGLVAAIVLPLAAASAYVAWRQYEAQHEALGRTLLSVSHALTAAADRELATGLALVQALSHSPFLDDGRLADFHRLAAKVAASRRDAWILLIESSGEIVVHTRRAIGTRLPNSFALDDAEADRADEPPRSGGRWVRRVFETGEPAFSDLFHGPISGTFVVAVAVPVVRGNATRYVLTIVMPASAFQPIVESLPQRQGSGAVLFDNSGFIIARAVEPEKYVGRRAPEMVRRSVALEPKPVDRGRNVAGEPFFRAVSRSQVSGWTAGVALSEDAAFGALWRSLAESIVLAALILTAGIVLALAMARSLARRRAAEEESRAKDEFIAALSHELRNPVSAISYSAELLRRSPSGALAEDAAERISRQVTQLRRLLDDLLDTTRAMHGKLRLELKPLELRDCASQVEREYSRLPGTGARIEVGGKDVWVRADPARLHQMIDNLLGNALKYGAKHVRLEVREEAGAGVLAVIDDGQGIAPGLMARLFQPFVQGEQSLERAKGGLGLGLALVRRLAELHAGSIAAESAGIGQGSRFTLRLPLAAPAAKPLEDASAAPAPAKRRVLVVEDLPDARESLRLLLEADGHVVAVAPDGPEGLRKLESFRPQVALVDIGLPGMDGYSLARELRAAAGARLALIALTGYGQEEDRRAAREAGFDQHLIKPVSRDELRKALAG